ncbi:hypothetical protein N9991_00720 [bacterium]|nr:hypothetical protein [bacterium]
MDIFYLRKSPRKDKKWLLEMPSFSHKHAFGATGYRDYTLINDKNSRFYVSDKEEREKIKKAYRARHRNDNIDSIHSPGAMSWYILWSEPTLEGGIRAYEKRFGVKIIRK